MGTFVQGDAMKAGIAAALAIVCFGTAATAEESDKRTPLERYGAETEFQLMQHAQVQAGHGKGQAGRAGGREGRLSGLHCRGPADGT